MLLATALMWETFPSYPWFQRSPFPAPLYKNNYTETQERSHTLAPTKAEGATKTAQGPTLNLGVRAAHQVAAEIHLLADTARVTLQHTRKGTKCKKKHMSSKFSQNITLLHYFVSPVSVEIMYGEIAKLPLHHSILSEATHGHWHAKSRSRTLLGRAETMANGRARPQGKRLLPLSSGRSLPWGAGAQCGQIRPFFKRGFGFYKCEVSQMFTGFKIFFVIFLCLNYC